MSEIKKVGGEKGATSNGYKRACGFKRMNWGRLGCNSEVAVDEPVNGRVISKLAEKRREEEKGPCLQVRGRDRKEKVWPTQVVVRRYAYYHDGLRLL